MLTEPRSPLSSRNNLGNWEVILSDFLSRQNVLHKYLIFIQVPMITNYTPTLLETTIKFFPAKYLYVFWLQEWFTRANVGYTAVPITLKSPSQVSSILDIKPCYLTLFSNWWNVLDVLRRSELSVTLWVLNWRQSRSSTSIPPTITSLSDRAGLRLDFVLPKNPDSWRDLRLQSALIRNHQRRVSESFSWCETRFQTPWEDERSVEVTFILSLTSLWFLCQDSGCWVIAWRSVYDRVKNQGSELTLSASLLYSLVSPLLGLILFRIFPYMSCIPHSYLWYPSTIINVLSTVQLCAKKSLELGLLLVVIVISILCMYVDFDFKL